MPDKDRFIGVAKEKIEKRISHYQEIIDSDTFDKTSAEYQRAQDVIEDLKDLLKKANPDHTFVDVQDIERRIEEYDRQLKALDEEYLRRQKEKLEQQVKAGAKPEPVAKSESEEEISLYDLIAEFHELQNKKVKEPTPEEIKAWQEGKPLESKQEPAQAEPKKEEKPAAEPKKEETLDDLIAEFRELQKKKVKEPTSEEIEAWKNGTIGKDEDAESKLAEVEAALSALEGRDSEDIELQRRITRNRKEELEAINKEQEVFMVTEKGEVSIKYPELSYEIDKEALVKEFEERRADMLDKFWGNRTKSKEYSKAMKTLRTHIVEKEFKYKDKDGNEQTATYETVEPYEGMEAALAFLQLEELPERLERLSKADFDESVYDNVTVRNADGKIVKLSPEEAREQDIHYIESKNNAYNRLALTRNNLRTLGKYGEKVPYMQMKEGQLIRNAARGVGNALLFVRNHTTAPLNRFVGSKIVSPVYGAVTGANKNVAGLYSNKATHRYVARREFYESQGQGFFASRFNSIFHAAEANKAILAAGLYDIEQSLRKKYTEIAEKQAFDRQIEFEMLPSVTEKLAKLKEDMQNATSEEDKAKLAFTVAQYEKAIEQLNRDRELNARTATAQTIQTDAIDYSQHDVANKENVTRTITGAKWATRLGIRWALPKFKEWLVNHTTKTTNVPVDPTQQQIEEALGIKDQKWVPTTWKPGEPIPIEETQFDSGAGLSSMMATKAGEKVEGFYSVYGGEARPAMYTLTGKEKITGIFESTGKGGHGLSDIAGLKAPVLTDGTFAQGLMDANGVLRQDITLEDILSALGRDSVNPEDLGNIYVSVGDRFWARLTDLCDKLTKTVVTGYNTDVPNIVDVAGHYESITAAEKLQLIAEAMKNPVLRAKVEALKSVEPIVTQNERVVKAMGVLGMTENVLDGALLADDVYEHARTTRSNEAWQKPQKTDFTKYADEFSGKRKIDMHKSKDDESSRDER